MVIPTLVTRRPSYKIRKQAETVLPSYTRIRQSSLELDERENFAKDIFKGNDLPQLLIRAARKVDQQQQSSIPDSIS
jgi:hypothetical protein